MGVMYNSNVSDEQIAKKVQDGDIESFGVLVERYEAKLKRYAKRFLFSYTDTEDLVQNVFIKTYTNIHGFDVKRRFSPWIYRIAHNEFINAIKKRKSEPFLFFDLDIIFPHSFEQKSPEYNLSREELREAVNKSLSELEPKYRESLILYYFEEMDYKSIAEVLRIPVSTVGIRLRRGRKKLKEIYERRQL